MRIRDIQPGDLVDVLALNNQHAVEVNALTEAELVRRLAVSARARCVDGRAGFLIAFDERTPEQGPNHAWFLSRQQRFLYVDRVVIAPSERGRGWGRRLYEDLASVANGRPLCCEVNLEPPNLASLAFHERLGFLACGDAVDPRDGKRIRYLVAHAIASSRPSDASGIRTGR